MKKHQKNISIRATLKEINPSIQNEMTTILNDRSLKKSAENGPEADRSLLLPGPIRHRQRDRCCCQTHSAFENLMNENGSRFLFSKGNTRRAQSVLLLDFLPVRGPVSKEEISKDKCST